MKNKSIIITISVVLFIIIAGGSFWVVKNQKENNGEVLQEEVTVQSGDNQNQKEVNMEEVGISNWKTYRDEKYGFEFNYPPNLTPEFGNEYGNVKLDVNFKEKELRGDAKYLAFALKVLDSQNEERDDTASSKESIKIGMNGYISALREFNPGSAQSAPFETVSFSENNLKFYYIFWIVGETNLDGSKFKQDKERILSSFKYLNTEKK